MKWLIILILIFSGCKEQDMASSGKGYNLSLVSTNGVESTASYVTTNDYNEEEEVLFEGFIYEKITANAVSYPWRKGVSAGTVSKIDGAFYVATEDIPVTLNADTGFDKVEKCPAWDELITQGAPVTVGAYTFESSVVGSTPHEALVTTVKNGTTLIYEGVLSSIVDGVIIDYWNNGYINPGCPGCVVVFKDGSLYGTTGTIGALSTLNGLEAASITDRGFVKVSVANPNRPFDVNNGTAAISVGAMSMIGEASHRFNAFTLANVIGESVTYSVKDPAATEIDSGIMDIDCWLDEDHLYEQKGVTLLIPVVQTMPQGSTIEITIDNGGNGTQLGTFEVNTVVDDGATGFDIEMTTMNFNSHEPNAWGEIELGAKPVITLLAYKIRGLTGEALNRAHRRHKSLEEAFSTVDVTDIIKKENTYSIKEAVKRGIMTVTKTSLVMENGRPSGYAEYTVSFREIV